MRKSRHRLATTIATKTKNVKRGHTRALAMEVISLLVRRCQFKRKCIAIIEGGSHFITDCRQVKTMLQSFVVNRVSPSCPCESCLVSPFL